MGRGVGGCVGLFVIVASFILVALVAWYLEEGERRVRKIRRGKGKRKTCLRE